jgi:holo-[acyl-carrier protein] synthase
MNMPLAVSGYLKGHGVDIVDIDRFSVLLNVEFEPFLNRYFTSVELNSIVGSSSGLEKLAGKFAVKESVLKALGVGWGNGISFVDVEVYNHDSGAPAVRLFRRLAELETEMNITGWLVSCTHTRTISMASVVAVGANP